MIDPCLFDLYVHILSLMERHCTGDMNPLCEQLIETLETLREKL